MGRARTSCVRGWFSMLFPWFTITRSIMENLKSLTELFSPSWDWFLGQFESNFFSPLRPFLIEGELGSKNLFSERCSEGPNYSCLWVGVWMQVRLKSAIVEVEIQTVINWGIFLFLVLISVGGKLGWSKCTPPPCPPSQIQFVIQVKKVIRIHCIYFSL